MLGAAAAGRIDSEALERRGVRPGTEKHYKSALAAVSGGAHIRLKGVAEKGGADYSVSLWQPNETKRSAWQFKHERLHEGEHHLVSRSPASADPTAREFEQGLAALKRAELGHGQPALALVDRLAGYRIYDPNTRDLRSSDYGSTPVGLTGTGLATALQSLQELQDKPIVDSLEQALELIDWVREIRIDTSAEGSPSAPPTLHFVDRFMKEERNRLTTGDASEGALYILFYAALAMHPDAPSLLAIDNFAQTLNPRLARMLMTRICEWTEASPNRCQWLLTAHNPAVLDALPLQDPDVRLFAVDRSTRGSTIINRIDLSSAESKRPGEDWTLSRMWMNGLLGAVPNV